MIFFFQFASLTLSCDFFSADVDECSAGTHECQQQCINTDGAYECECAAGYTLVSDGKSCTGECAAGYTLASDGKSCAGRWLHAGQ